MPIIEFKLYLTYFNVYYWFGNTIATSNTYHKVSILIQRLNIKRDFIIFELNLKMFFSIMLILSLLAGLDRYESSVLIFNLKFMSNIPHALYHMLGARI